MVRSWGPGRSSAHEPWAEELDEEHAPVAFDDGVRADLHVLEVGEPALRTAGPVASVDASGHEKRAVARAVEERHYAFARRSLRKSIASSFAKFRTARSPAFSR